MVLWRWALMLFGVAIMLTLMGFAGMAGDAADLSRFLFAVFTGVILLLALVIGAAHRSDTVT